MQINILAVGDVSGPPGTEFLAKRLAAVKKFYGAAFVVVNGENASISGITPAQAEDLFTSGADVITLGNHAWGRQEIKTYLDDSQYILRPSNFAPQCPGRGWGVYSSSAGELCVMNLIGRCNMPFGNENPFFEAERIIKGLKTKLILIDMHAEATSEKLALGYHLDGRVSAVWGTHTHVQTSDARILPNGTGYITDIGMTGACESVLGIRPEQSISMFLGNPPQRYAAALGAAKLEGAVFTLDTDTGLCLAVEAIRIT